MNLIQNLLPKTRILICVWIFAVSGFAWGEEANSNSSPGAGQPGETRDREEVMQGTWKFETVGVAGQWGQTKEGLSQKFSLVFLPKAVEGNIITGRAFFPISRSKLNTARPGGSVNFSTYYKVGGGEYEAKWRGTLSEDGTKITDGTFSMTTGHGTFTAEKK